MCEKILMHKTKQADLGQHIFARKSRAGHYTKVSTPVMVS